MLHIESLITPPTTDEVFDVLLGTLEDIGVPARSWNPGGVARSILGVAASLGASGAALVSSLIRGSFLTLAKGDYLEAHTIDVYDEARIRATFATGFVTLTNAGGAVYNIGADEMIVRASTTGARFRVSEAFTLGAMSSITVPVQAVDAGSRISVAPGQVNELETTLTKVSVANATAITGKDAESDEELVARVKAKRGTWSPFGPRDAYEYAALSARLPDGSPTSVSRVSVTRIGSQGLVRVVCATPTGAPTPDDLDAVIESIEKYARPDSVTAAVQGAVEVPTTHGITIWARKTQASTVETLAQQALSSFIATYPIGGISKIEGGQGYLYSDAISGAVLGALRVSYGIDAYDLDFDDASDIALAANEVATNTTTFTVRVTS